MAKLTLAGIAAFAQAYVDASKQAGTFSASTNNTAGLVDKIGKQITIDGLFQDKLPELNGDDLPLGKTIEEYFIDMTLPTAYTNAATEGAKDVVPELPTFEACAYSYTLGRKKVKTTVSMNDYDRAMLSSESAGNLVAKIVERLQNSYDITRYAIKKQLLGNAGDKAVTAGRVESVAKPVDTTTGEAMIKKVKELVEAASFANEGGLVSGAVIGAAPELVLYVKKGIIPSLEVETMAGAFNKEDLAMPCKIKVVEDFGTQVNSDVWGILVDPRGIKLHNGYSVVRSSENADGDFINYVRHFECTGFISKYAYICALEEPQA